MRELVSNILGCILLFALFVVPATGLAALIGGGFGSIAGEQGQWWGALGCGGLAFIVVSCFLGLDALS